MKRTALAFLMAAALSPAAQASGYRIEHMEPAFWWSGMQHKRLQLMVHGAHIADLQPALNYPGVRIEAVSRVANPNYLFIDLALADSAAPGQFDISFSRDGKTAASYRYRLLEREPGSAQRKGFGPEDVIYNLMPDRFANGDSANDSVPRLADKLDRKNGSGRHGGDLRGMAQSLDYLAGMGYTQIWPTPLVENDMPAYSYHGYASTNHYKVDERFGSNEDYRSFVAQAKAKGIGVIQDVVLNHIGSRHWWMQDMPMPDWISYEGKPVMTAHHRVATQDPYASKEDARNFTEGWFSKGMPDMNQANPYVANYLIQNSIWWIEYAGLSGLRVDTYGYSNVNFLTEWSRRLTQEYPNINLVGEEWSNHVPIVARWQRGKQNFDGYRSYMPSMMDFPLNDVLRKALSDTDGTWSLKDLYETLSMDYLYPDAHNLVLFEGNHDLARTFSVLHGDPALFRMAMAYVLTAPRIPQLYYGSEVLMTSTTKGRDDPSYRQDFPGGWAGDKVNAFTGEGLSAQQREAQAFLKKLLNWRKGAGVIHHGKTMHFGPEQDSYVFFRYDGKKKVMVSLNRNTKDVTLDAGRFREMLAGVRSGRDVISGKEYPLRDSITLPARSALILELQ
ncbi:glycoside hydrolase family 13 protein [Massilia endophytica]|uniref:glycoside hydrolase family 13 protein n=1 Tax=Massilia endophytica TaxID=2899220 RepID=UPI001E3C6C79|nr:glycoside hydrolase family 13 protein [Massilia endophytica]UGQ45381.1 glycoside hydrolase family 13 protein [Massilia endophytica]